MVSATTSQPVVLLKDVAFSYGGAPVLDNVNLRILTGDFLWVVGPNGGGKTTLIRIILGLLRPQAGIVRVFGEEPARGRLRIGYMPQQVKMDLQFPATVMDLTLMGRLGHSSSHGRYSSTDRQAAINALESVDLVSLSSRRLSDLSGGELRRLLIARALACTPDLLILDEPTANLDKSTEHEMFDLLEKLNEHITIVMVSHDPAFVSSSVERVACVNRTVSVHPTESIDDNSVMELYGVPVRAVRHDLHQRNNGDA